MFSIEKNLEKFTSALLSNESICCDRSGNWYREEGFWSVVRWIRGEESRLVAIGSAFSHLLDRMEKIPVIFGAHIEEQKRLFDMLIFSSGAVKGVLKASHSTEVSGCLSIIDRKIIGLRYRIEKIHGGLDPTGKNNDLFKQIADLALKWKGAHWLWKVDKLSDRDLRRITEVSRYPEYAQLLLDNVQLRERFFLWIIRDNCEVRQYIEFPATCKRIKDAYLASRIGRFGSHLFPILYERGGLEKGSKKGIFLPFCTDKNRTVFISILDESKEVSLQNQWKLKIKQILDIFAQRNDCPLAVDIDMFGSQGISNWNAFHLGSWNPEKKKHDLIDVTRAEWWKSLPINEEITKEQFFQRYQASPGDWIACVKATRETADLDLDLRHGYIELAIPSEEGRYKIYQFGKWPEILPQKITQVIPFLVSTGRGRIAYPDENVFFPHRQQASVPIKMTPEQGVELMESIGKDIKKGREGNLVFQFGFENCAHWVQSKIEAVFKNNVPNFFKLEMLKSQPRNAFLGQVFNFLRCLSSAIQKLAFKIFCLILGSWKGMTVEEEDKKVFKSAHTNPYANDLVIFQPGYLHQQIESSFLQGVITAGN